MKLSLLKQPINEGWKEQLRNVAAGAAIGIGAGGLIGNKLNKIAADKPDQPDQPKQIKKEPEYEVSTPPPGYKKPVLKHKEPQPQEEPQKQTHIDLNKIMDYIKHFEGVKNKAYTDTKGKRTIGAGFNLDRKDAEKIIKSLGYNFNDIYNGKVAIKEEDVNKLLKDETEKAIENAKLAVKNFDNLPIDIKYVVVDMAYNMGLNKLSAFEDTIAALNRNDFAEAAKEMVDSPWFNQVKRRSKHHVKVVRNHAK